MTIRVLLRGFVLFALGLFLSACNRYSREEKFLETVGAQKLTALSTALATSNVKGELPVEKWPQNFAQHGVLQVKPYFDGLQVILERRGKFERGVFVAGSQNQTPEDGSGITFVRLTNGIYWFEQKNRVQYIPPE